ncbi:lipoprotein Spr [Parabacteroides sp. PF5-5]|uniref:C40 family peptidase n=1 Tax=unclassified Parabacteroides TaxID=2649774 RepID=UPI002474FBE2|nr:MULTISPECIES: NlpC/P60 family protein [unclassified Parabacteroides]MDH6306484.1 lipoprotein Spr [Parabacteroides sp. PH5-39]MDH6317451.1 lipoprotein Spr [Parabacteroides sp. PF5-13]MDH6321246.1 lipoprotein Spr [Parabacteroides sp. PH5-13]MDH6324978.1 lipoprotein Spr [Parabacteroides sp. PH5-8]MDH6328687.1 lipoprotein Spr [Parabacteroides sp. PH5-41]
MKINQISIIILLFIVFLFTSCGAKKQVPVGARSPNDLSKEFGFRVTNKDNLHLYTELASWKGVPHRNGGNTKKGVDCSGLVVQVYNKVYNKKLARSSADILKKNCRKVKRGSLQEGDLVFFKIGRGQKKTPNHVGIYLKNQYFMHASSSSGVVVSSLNDKYYTRYWLTGGKVK